MRWLVSGAFACAVGVSAALLTTTAAAQPKRSEAWDTATTVMAASAMGLEFLMPRTFYSDPEVTVGWKARWHVSVLAPSMTLATLALFNEVVLKDAFEGHRPGCNQENQGLTPRCTSYAMLSTHSFAAFSAFGQGFGVFLVDTLKWSGGRFNFGSFTGNVLTPAVLSVITGVGRTAGNWENAGQVWGSAGIGAVVGLGMGALYSLTQRPECGYSGSLICW